MITTYQANIENNMMIGQRGGVVADTFYIALSTTALNASGGGLSEPSDPNYRRLAVKNDTAEFSSSSGGVIKNSKTWMFEISSRVWTNPVTHWAIIDALTGGNVLYYDALTTPLSVDVNQVVFFNPGSVQIKRSGV